MHADRFTIKSQEAIQAAQRLAGARRNPQVAPVRARANEQLDSFPVVTGDAAAAPEIGQAIAEVLRRADDEARGMGDEYVSTEHLLLALSGDPNIDLQVSHDQLLEAVNAIRGPHRVTDQSPEDKYQALERYGRDLTKAAEDGKLDPVIGRADEIRRVIQVLSRRTKNNPVLIGEPGVGKTAIVEGL